MVFSLSLSDHRVASRASGQTRARFRSRFWIKKHVSYALAPKEERRRGGKGQEKRRKEEKRARWTFVRLQKKKKKKSEQSLPYQRVAVGAAPVVRQLEQGAQRPLVLGIESRAHIFFLAKREREIEQEGERARRQRKRNPQKKESEKGLDLRLQEPKNSMLDFRARNNSGRLVRKCRVRCAWSEVANLSGRGGNEHLLRTRGERGQALASESTQARLPLFEIEFLQSLLNDFCSFSLLDFAIVGRLIV